MDTSQAYDQWSADYDTVTNPTRDLEAVAFRAALGGHFYKNALEIGCGTGKNTAWLAENAAQVTAADFSPEMLAQARAKLSSKKNIRFERLDVRGAWPFAGKKFDLVTCSLILEHIEDLGHVFSEARRVLKKGSIFYLGELHPFKQYSGSKARFETGEGVFVLECFTHHASDFFAAGAANGFEAVALDELFDNGDRGGLPRILAMKFRKKG